MPPLASLLAKARVSLAEIAETLLDVMVGRGQVDRRWWGIAAKLQGTEFARRLFSSIEAKDRGVSGNLYRWTWTDE